MSDLREAKVLVVNEITRAIEQSKSVVVAKYQGLTVENLQELRKEAKAHGVSLKVYKNRLVKQATSKLNYEALNDYLVGANIYVFGNEDDISAAKVIANFAKKFQALEIVAGIYENRVIDAKEVAVVATLPTYEEALMILGNSLLTPLRQLGLGMKMLVDENKIQE
ncbi:50S ribosomal protein L10 [Mycoplasma miroungirhinis]|uniref:Large ribosomal subunit protein uL10 n=1 Tax=Mycoplasma miroungirhinis TaxID=754516 RepID=A0A6M4JB23_9MOLU|nr:50S ribosomal protein L10 [Mycoplasma miroungirhinis]QJR44110.1 50S ribosomal protein L10 [Mycoplasma miroungirhinis]